MTPFRLALRLGPLVLLVAPACDGGGSSGAPPPTRQSVFEIASCSLGCVPGVAGITCARVDVHVNEELRFTFTRPVALASVFTTETR